MFYYNVLKLQKCIKWFSDSIKRIRRMYLEVCISFIVSHIHRCGLGR
jgi:hypothetical protein